MLSYERLRNMVVLVTAAIFFTAVVLGTKMKLSVLASHVLKAAKRVFGIPDFRYHALSDGVRELLSRFPLHQRSMDIMTPVTQILLFDSQNFGEGPGKGGRVSMGMAAAWADGL